MTTLTPKFGREVYRALYDAGYSKREIARVLNVNEASVRRGLKGYERRLPGAAAPERRFLVTVTEVD